MPKSYDVISVGSATVDVFVDTTSELIKIKSIGKDNNVVQEEDLLAYPSGAKILIKNLDFQIGGGGTNTAVAFRRLGLKVGYVGKLGNDDGGSKVIAMLKKEKIDYLGTFGKGMTPYSIILDSIEQDRTILAYKGVIDTMTAGELKLGRLKTKWFYFSALVDDSFRVLEFLGDYAEQNGIKVAFNPSSYLAERGSKYLERVLRNTTLIVLNKEEAESIVGKGDIKSILLKLTELGPKIAVITDGKHGAYCHDSEKDAYYKVKTHKVKVIETTGAGDAFASSFLTGYIKKNDVRFALQLGLANAESVVSGKGAKTNLLNYKSALARMKKFPARVEKL